MGRSENGPLAVFREVSEKMFSFGVKNLRRLYNVEPIDLKPITILVGRNSSGKSTFLRALPLLRQSALTRTSSPILWFGDFVDFGSYEGAVSDNDSKRNIAFKFALDDFVLDARRYYGYNGFVVANPSLHRMGVQCEITLRAHRDVVQLCFIEVSMSDGTNFSVKIEEGGTVSALNVNGKNCLNFFPGTRFNVSQGSILPVLFAAAERAESLERALPFSEIRASASYLAKLYKPWLDKRMKEDAVTELCALMLLESDFSKQVLEATAGKTSVRSFSKLLKEIAGRDVHNLYEITKQVHKASQAVTLFRGLSERLREIISSVLYIGPARARSERYYRYQDLSVSEIDSDGKNFPMFLNSLREAQFKNLSGWVESLFGYRLELTKSAGHISINVVEGNAKTNVVDTGYGVSQILPVLGQIWWSLNKPADARRPRSNQVPSLLVIEQPELHLHPAHQAFLADALVQVIARSRQSTRRGETNFVIETHSETLVNRLGRMIGEGKLSQDDVQIVLFEPDEDGDERRTSVRIANFGEDGQLINWPYGFFQPSV